MRGYGAGGKTPPRGARGVLDGGGIARALRDIGLHTRGGYISIAYGLIFLLVFLIVCCKGECPR